MRKRLAKRRKATIATPVRRKKRMAKLRGALEGINERYAGVFKRLAE